jgi:hypothetical protein
VYIATKQIDVWYYYICEKVENGIITNVDYLNTKKNPADVLTRNIMDNDQEWIRDPKQDDGLLEQGECQSELIQIVMSHS